MKLNHLHFQSARPRETSAFYQEYFGFRAHVELGPTVVLANDERFFLAIDPAPGAEPVDGEALHFGFCLRDADEVRMLYALMKGAGVPFTKDLTDLSPNATQFYCVDPAGNRVEVGWYRPL